MRNVILVILSVLLAMSIASADTIAAVRKVVSYPSPATGLTLKATVLLPNSYRTQPDRHYPVMYMLHGHTGNFTSRVDYARFPIRNADDYQIIIVLADGGNSFYVNWDGQTDGKPHRGEIDWNEPARWSPDGNRRANVPGFSTQTERTPKGFMFSSPARAQAHSLFHLLSTLKPDAAPYIHLNCGIRDDFYVDNRLLVEALR